MLPSVPPEADTQIPPTQAKPDAHCELSEHRVAAVPPIGVELDPPDETPSLGLAPLTYKPLGTFPVLRKSMAFCVWLLQPQLIDFK